MTLRPADGLGTQLRRLIELLDGDLERLYAEDVEDYRPRYTPVMKVLADGAAHTIKEIAGASSISHSAASQTVSQMVGAGLVVQRVGQDARERHVQLTRRGRELLPFLQRIWTAAGAAEREMEREIGAPVRATLAAMVSALERRPFYERLRARSEVPRREGKTR